MKSVFTDSLKLLESQAARHPAIAVAYSGGKDSLVVMDLCAKVFQAVKAFFFYTAPGLEVCEAQMRLARERWNVDVVQIPHWRRLDAMKLGVWCDVKPELRDLPDLDLKHGYAYGMHVTGCDLMATGMKDADGYMRRSFFSNVERGGNWVWKRVMHPIKEWTKRDVISYLNARKIPLPDQNEGAVTSGVGLSYDSLCWLHDKHPEDFTRLLQWYPYAEAVIKRREWFGI